MIALLNKWRSLVILLSAAATVIVLGCGDSSGLERRYKVSGTVKYKGEPVKVGNITFEPTNPPMPQGRIAYGYIEDGKYTLTTATEGDGALPGEYKVLITSSTLDVSKLATKGPLHQGSPEHQKALKEAKNPLPMKYARSETTPLKAKVETHAMTLDFNLED